MEAEIPDQSHSNVSATYRQPQKTPNHNIAHVLNEKQTETIPVSFRRSEVYAKSQGHEILEDHEIIRKKIV